MNAGPSALVVSLLVSASTFAAGTAAGSSGAPVTPAASPATKLSAERPPDQGVVVPGGPAAGDPGGTGDEDGAGARVTARSSVPSLKARIGDRIPLTCTIDGPEGWLALGPGGVKAGDALGPFHVLDVTSSGKTATIVLGADETGALEVPSFELIVRTPAGAEQRIPVAKTSVVVTSVLGEGDSTSLSDLKPPAEFRVPWPWKTIFLALAGAALLALGIVWLVRRYRRRERVHVIPEDALPPGVTPDAWAREALENLLAQHLAESGKMRAFHIALADLARRYLELRFRIPALERTTEEIGEEMTRALVDGEIAALTRECLVGCDRVKFAKYAPDLSEAQGSCALFRSLVERTVTRAEPVPVDGALRTAEGTA